MSATHDLKGKAYRGLAWQVGSISFTASANIVFVAVMGRLLDPAAFGEFALASVVVGLTMVFAQFGFGPALVQRQDLSESDISFAFAVTMAIGLASAAAISLAAGSISSAFDGKVEPLMIRVLSLNLVFGTLGAASRFLLIRELEFRRLFAATAGSYVVGNMGVGFALAAAGYDAWALVIGLIAGNLVASVMMLFLRPIRLSGPSASTGARSIFGYGVGLTMVQLLNTSAQQVDKLLIGNAASLPLLGAFERAQRIQGLPQLYAGNTIDGVFFSVMSKSADERRTLGRLFFPVLSMLAFAMAYVSVVAHFFADDIVRLMLGGGWDEAGRILGLLAVVIFLQTFSQFGDTLVRSTNEFMRSIVVKAIFLGAMAGFVALGAVIGGFNGAVLGVVAASALHAVGMVVLCLRITGHPISDFLARLIPVLGFGTLLIVKNRLLELVVPDDLLIMVAAVLGSDAVIALGYFVVPRLLGKRNAEFVADRLSDIDRLSAVASSFRRGMRWRTPATSSPSF